MNEQSRKALYDTALEWTYESGKHIREKMENTYNVDIKAHQHDLVTDVDRSVEQFFRDRVKKSFPAHRIMGEEGLGENVEDLKGTVWIIDPIDGTVNFVHQGCYFAVSVGIFHNGEPVAGIVYDVMADEMFSALAGKGLWLNGKPLPQLADTSIDEALLSFNNGWMMKDRRLEELVRQSRGIRSYGAAALEMAYVACGRIEAYISFNLAPWDVAGGYVLITEAGGTVTNYTGEPLTFLKKDTLLAANASVYHTITDLLEQAGNETR
ncbi:inositol monophosphatase family protein [Alteribacter natronophilus]|uniref:inositol monophosphatase family protein n=1 Tax=Alteribacter natronophilus TaxID=2583810 RepID=UPI00110E3B68|nr:inositol monophosphatase family protein [Alteribacter natronophilus]TMW73046.1 inositol monophosphatase family protein [Alteribacter natronophilus]